MREAIEVLMNSTPSRIDPLRVRGDLQSLGGVQSVHDLHIWSVSQGQVALSVHLVSVEMSESILNNANRILKEKHRIDHTTIQIEHPDRFDSKRCFECAHVQDNG